MRVAAAAASWLKRVASVEVDRTGRAGLDRAGLNG